MVMEMRPSKSSDAISGWKGQLGRGHQSHDGNSSDFVGFDIFDDLTNQKTIEKTMTIDKVAIPIS